MSKWQKKGLDADCGALLGTSEDAPSNDTMEVEHSEKKVKKGTLNLNQGTANPELLLLSLI